MDLGMIKMYLEQDRDKYNFDLVELSNIEVAFDELVATGVELRDLPENATVWDQLEELEAYATPMERYLYEWIVKNFGENEAQDPSYSTFALAGALNKLPIEIGFHKEELGNHLIYKETI